MTTGPERGAAGGGAGQAAAGVDADLYRLLVSAVRDYAIFALDAHGHIITWNQGAERFKGYRPEEIIGRHFSTFYPAGDIAAGKPQRELEIAARDGRLEDEGWRVRKDGTLFWANVVITALRDETGQLVGFAKVTRDLTERRASYERSLEDARRLAETEAASRAKSGFLAALSHELRTPLNAIGGYVDLLLLGVRGELTEEQRADLGRIRASQRHLLGLINDLLNLSRIEAGRLTYQTRAVLLGPLVESTCGMVAPQAAAKPLHLEWHDCDDGLAVLADPLKLEQILLNLVSNAVKFTPIGGQVEVSCARRGEMIEVRVRDTGPGIAKDEVESIFEPFVQLGRSLSSVQEGAGLGLSISRELARAMGGELAVTSVPGAGSTFTLTMPATEPPEEPEPSG
ncbi:MAG TPA: PAS domain-containing sensor histidine kinase [Longimicrobiales bacterium]|nr:PAS domain-containing sensor histidine kinase [Longimicrobiales bacterium]